MIGIWKHLGIPTLAPHCPSSPVQVWEGTAGIQPSQEAAGEASLQPWDADWGHWGAPESCLTGHQCHPGQPLSLLLHPFTLTFLLLTLTPETRKGWVPLTPRLSCSLPSSPTCSSPDFRGREGPHRGSCLPDVLPPEPELEPQHFNGPGLLNPTLSLSAHLPCSPGQCNSSRLRQSTWGL